MSETTVLDFTPWVGRYKEHIDWQISTPADASLPAMLSAVARRYEKKKAFTCVLPNGMNGELTFEQVEDLSDDLAIFLREVLGLEAGKRVALQMPNSLAFPVAAFAILKAGCVLVNVNPLYTAEETKHQIKDAGADTVIVIDMCAAKLKEIQADAGVRHVIVSSVASFFPPVVKHIVKLKQRWWDRTVRKLPDNFIRLEAALAEGAHLRQTHHIEARRYWRNLAHHDLALLQYTGGTTGAAKGAMLSHGNLLWNVEQIVAMGKAKINDGEEVILTALPLYHIFAFTINLLAFFKVGGHAILIPNPRPSQTMQRAFDNYPITWITGVNTLFSSLLDEEWFHTYPPKHLKISIGGGSPIQASVIKRWERETGSRLMEGYGLTEASPLISFQPLMADTRLDCVGIPAPHTDVRLVDDAGYPVPPGMPGELIVRGPQVMHGYWKLPNESSQVLRDGWLHTGDIAVLNKDFTFSIVDRKKDVIRVSGSNVYPNEIEEVIASHEKVMEAAVIGVPVNQHGEEVHAYVVPRDASLTEEELRQHCTSHLVAYKVPIRFVLQSHLPKSTVGKVLRRTLREHAVASTTQQGPERFIMIA